MTFEIRRGNKSWLASDYEVKYEQGYRCDHNNKWFRWPTVGFHEVGREGKRRKWIWADEIDVEICEATTGRQMEYFHACIKEDT